MKLVVVRFIANACFTDNYNHILAETKFQEHLKMFLKISKDNSFNKQLTMTMNIAKENSFHKQLMRMCETDQKKVIIVKIVSSGGREEVISDTKLIEYFQNSLTSSLVPMRCDLSLS